MAVLKILLLLAVVQVVHPKPFLFKEVKLKKNFEFSLKPVLKPFTFITEFIPVKVKHGVEKRSPSSPPPSKPEPPAPLFKIDLEKSIEIKPVLPHKEEEINKQPPPHVGKPPGHPKNHEEIHEQHFYNTPKPPPVGKLLTRFDIGPSSVLPPESHEGHLPHHVPFPSVSPPPHVGPVDHLRETRVSVSPPPLGPHIPQVAVGHEHHLLVEPKPKVTEHLDIVHEGPILGGSESSSRVIHGHPPPPPPPHLDEIKPLSSGNENQGTLEAFFGPRPVGIKEKPEHFPDVPPHHASDLQNEVTRQGPFPLFARPPSEGIEEKPEAHHHTPVLPHQVTGQGSFPVPNFARPPPAGFQERPVPQRGIPGLTEQGTYTGFVRPVPEEIQESNKPPRSSLLTDISRADEISAYLKAIDALPLVKPPLEENVLLLVPPSNSVEPAGPKETAVENKADTSSLARGSRLALYFGNILLQVMSQAIGSARSAIGQYSMPKVF